MRFSVSTARGRRDKERQMICLKKICVEGKHSGENIIKEKDSSGKYISGRCPRLTYKQDDNIEGAEAE